MSSAAASSSAGESDGATDKEVGAYWSVEAGAKRSWTSKAAMSSGGAAGGRRGFEVKARCGEALARGGGAAGGDEVLHTAERDSVS